MKLSVYTFLFLALIILVTIQCADKEVVMNSPGGAFTDFVLKNGAKVQVGPASQLTSKGKILHLTGEAGFDTDKALEIHTDNGIIKSKSGKFRVMSRRTTMNVWCYEGGVHSSNVDGGAAKDMVGGEIVSYRGKNMANFDKRDINQMTSNKYFIFDSESLLYVFECLEAQFGMKVKVNDANTNVHFTGMVAREDIQMALGMVFTPLLIDYNISGGEIVLSKRKM